MFDEEFRFEGGGGSMIERRGSRFEDPGGSTFEVRGRRRRTCDRGSRLEGGSEEKREGGSRFEARGGIEIRGAREEEHQGPPARPAR